MNQDTLRVDIYQGLTDIIENTADNEINLNNLGQWVILPLSFTGSAQNMFEIFQDSMVIIRYYKHLDIFLTMTANPSWLEITNALLLGQKVSDHSDLVLHVFEVKKQALLNDIKRNNIFGKAVAHVYTIEF